ncbi:serine/threonine protein kinase [Ponticoccus sp. SC2-23]|uniref:serine/threonine-protein kinase n=1 Tax=Alexandriicola marinus TaxID=2081710 RepID=UPI000FDCA09F|nr:serine/threonine-protein kinase [Alexandriicola marinus]MBM1220862.1 serine/threonine protein kinase [Ponticoccus sp. SC6-9]MBM1225432.1 serine/threonine protein kinase [Ponticoccus sp. SC6-15]MBM1227615.1 serine/threonine protein kinase [Ponticoccus sp. SC6-38]MBM1234747.1 serine/threonine protein kinase [Ponticoccus sp. SC6-45]MBM1238117.1 serine/threonine protein kinase [Ponticoccus sp. SC6-49]MBM1244250.1 serine/threonine protein kinase [Ponticoccus sp. SC2-64]MBM1248271.1 serine/thre
MNLSDWIDYKDLTYLGESNHGTYYRARPPARLGIAVKVMLKVLYRGASDQQWHAVAREIRLLSGIKSKYVASLLDAGHDNGRLYYALTYPALGTLADPVRSLSQSETLRALEAGARGLDVLHRAAVLHRDFKPAKIFIGVDGCRLTDLGTADETQERQGAPVPTGSIGFMAPEVARGYHASVASDVFSLGASMHRVLTGRDLYPDVPRENIVAALRHLASAPPTIMVEGVPEALRPVMKACLAVKPADRPASAAIVADEIAAAITEEPVYSAASW